MGAIEIANDAKHEFTGPGARGFLDRLLAGRLPKPGRMNLTPMLTPKGKLYGDLTVACLGAGTFYLFGSGAAQAMHRRWFDQHLPARGLAYLNRSAPPPALALPGPTAPALRAPSPPRAPPGGGRGDPNPAAVLPALAIAGPNAAARLSRMTRVDVSAEAFRFRDIRRVAVGAVPAILARISFSGELGYEIYCAPQYQLRLFEAIEDAGRDLGLRLYGNRALMALRLEKGWGAWTLDFRPDFTAAEAGLDAFLACVQQRRFIGKAAAPAARPPRPPQQLGPLATERRHLQCAP